MKKFRAIIVGAGGISDAWIPFLLAEGVEIAAVVDRQRPAAEEKAARHKLKTFVSNDLQRTIRDCPADFVVDLTTPESHCQVVCQALKAGFHVIGEKPMAVSMAQAQKMVRTAETAGRLYMVSQSRRYNQVGDTLARTVVAGKIGRLSALTCDFFIGFHFTGFRNDMPSVLFLDMAIHHFDLARMICGKDPVAVYAEEFNPVGSWYRGNPAGQALFEMADGVRFAYRGNCAAEGCATSSAGNWRIIGEKGTMLWESETDFRGQVVAGTSGFLRAVKPLSFVKSPLRHYEQHGAIREMLRFLRTGQKPQGECHDNIKSLAMVFAAVESSRKKKRVPIQPH